MRTATQLAEAFEASCRVLVTDEERRLITAALRRIGDTKRIARNVVIVPTATLAGEEPQFMVLVNGFQWGPPGSTPDASGAYPDTWPTIEEAETAYRDVVGDLNG